LLSLLDPEKEENVRERKKRERERDVQRFLQDVHGEQRAQNVLSFVVLRVCFVFLSPKATILLFPRLVNSFLLRGFHFFSICVNLYKALEKFSSDVYYYSAIYYHHKQSNTSVYVGVIIAGALVGEKMVNKGFDSMWESRNKGKLFKDLKLPDAEE